jgi:hypothetical protein
LEKRYISGRSKIYLYIITGKLRARNFALNIFTNQILKNRYMAQIADWEELYYSFDLIGVVYFLAWIPDYIPRSPTVDPIISLLY